MKRQRELISGGNVAAPSLFPFLPMELVKRILISLTEGPYFSFPFPTITRDPYIFAFFHTCLIQLIQTVVAFVSINKELRAYYEEAPNDFGSIFHRIIIQHYHGDQTYGKEYTGGELCPAKNCTEKKHFDIFCDKIKGGIMMLYKESWMGIPSYYYLDGPIHWPAIVREEYESGFQSRDWLPHFIALHGIFPNRMQFPYIVQSTSAHVECQKYLEVLQWLRENECPWNVKTCHN
jgi:hypothetical protein